MEDKPPRSPSTNPPTSGPSSTRATQRRFFAAVRVPVERKILTVIEGVQAGQVFPLSEERHVLGRGELADLRIDDADVSRVHAHFLRLADGNYVVQDARSTNGTFLGQERIEGEAPLKSGDRVQIGTSLVLRYSITDDIEQETYERLLAASTRDVLTRTFNQRYLLERLRVEVAYSRRQGTPLSLLVANIDGMSRVNEACGRDAGDALLKVIAGRLTRLVRVEDLVARCGSDEFAVLARSTPVIAAVALANRLRASVSELKLPWKNGDMAETVRATVSFGVAGVPELQGNTRPGALLELARERVRMSKTSGGDTTTGPE